MNTQANAMHEPFQREIAAPAAIPVSRAFYWAVRRELWENRSLYMAPLAVAAVVLVAFSIGSILGIGEPRLRLEPSRPQMPYEMAAGVLMLTIILVSVFYCLDALHSERRDRSILFWKSLPVSDVDDRARQGKHSSDRLAAARVCHNHRHAVVHVAGEQRCAAGKWTERGDVMEELAACKHVATVAVSPCHWPCDLAVSNLLLVAAGVWLGAACNILVGGIAAGGYCRSRRHRVSNQPLRGNDRAPVYGRRSGYADGTAKHGTRSHDNPCHRRQISYESGLVDRLRLGCGLSGRSGAPAPLPGADLTCRVPADCAETRRARNFRFRAYGD